MLIAIKKSTGELLTDSGGAYYSQGRPDDTVPVRSGVPTAIRYYADDNSTRVLLDPATGVLTFAALPNAGDTFTVGTTIYTATPTLPTNAADEVLLGVSLAQFIANLVGAVNGASTAGQAAGTTYSTGTVANPLAQATAGVGTTVLLAARAADASGNAVATATTSAHAAFAHATLTGGPVISLDVKEPGAYDANPILPSPTFTAPADPATGDYVGILDTLIVEALALLDPNNANGATPNAQEPDDAPLMVQVRWGAPGARPNRSGEWKFSLANVVAHGGEGVPTSANGPLTPAVVATAVAQAAAATAALAALPPPVDTSAAPIHPFTSYLTYLPNFFDPTGLFVAGPTNLISSNLLALALQTQLSAGNPVSVVLQCALPQEGVNQALAILDGTGFNGGYVSLAGGGMAIPTLDVPQVNGAATLDFSVLNNVYALADVGCGGLSLFFDSGIPFSASGNGTIGVQDSPSGEDVAGYIAANYGTGTLTLSADGAVLSLTDANPANLPLSSYDDADTQTVITITTPGNPPTNLHALNMRARGTNVVTN